MPFTTTKTKMAAAFAGMLADVTHHDTESYVNEEAAAELPFGCMVQEGAAAGGALICTATGNTLAGIVRHQHAYNLDNELGTIGLKPKATLGILKRGRIYVQVDQAVNPKSPVRVRVTTNGGANGTTSGPGTFRTAAVAGHTVNISTYAAFGGTTTGADIVELKVDMVNRATGVAD